MTHDEMIAVIQAHKEGKRLECRDAGNELSQWVAVGGDPAWSFSMYDYRIARERRKCWVKFDHLGTTFPLSVPHHMLTESLAEETGWQLVTEEIK